MHESVEIRTVPAEDKLAWLKTVRTGLLGDPGMISEAARAFWDEVWEPERILGGYAGGRCVASLRTFATTLSVPTSASSTTEIPADALTQVSVAATHRRRGTLRAMLTRSLNGARERGEVVSLLRAAEWPIYGRFGYWPATSAADYEIATTGVTVADPRSPVGIEQLEPAELLEPAVGVLERARGTEHGHIARPLPMWRSSLRLGSQQREPVCVLARDADGDVAGYAVWTANDGDWFHDHTEARAAVHQFMALTPDAERALWGYLLGIDLVRVLTLDAHRVDLPLEWLLSDGRAARRTWTGDNDWLRILDLPAALRARRYAVPDRLVLQVHDPDGGWTTGRYLLDGGPDHAECGPTTESPDISLSQRALAAVYLGGRTVRSQVLAGLVEEERPGALGRLQLMFATERAPWNATPF